MPLSAHFVGDFNSFNAATQKAVANLKSFDEGLKTVDRDLARFGNQFSGRTVIQNAVLMEKAVQEVGGVSKLTASELQRVGTAAQNAVEKMKLMGIDVPPQLQKLANAIKPVEQQLTLAGKAANVAQSSFGQMFAAFSAANLINRAASSLVGFTTKAFETADALTDMSDQTGIGVEELQRLQAVANASGTSLDALTTASGRLGVTVAEGGKKAIAAIDTLGLSLKDLQGSTAEQQLKKVLVAAADLEDQGKRNLALQALTGKGYQEMAGASKAFADGVADDAKVIGAAHIAMLNETKRQYDAFWTEAELQWAGWVATGISKLNEMEREMLDWLDRNPFTKAALDKVYSGLGLPSVDERRRMFEERQQRTTPAPPPKPVGGGGGLGKEIDTDLQRLLDAQARLREGFFGDAIKEAKEFAAALGSIDKLKLGDPEAIRKALALMEAANAEAQRMGTTAGPAVARFYAELQKLATLPSTMPFHMSMFTAIPPAVTAAAASIEGRLLPAFNRIASVPLDDITNGLYKLPSMIGMINQQISKPPEGGGFFGGIKGGFDSLLKGLGGGEGKGFGGILNNLGKGIVDGFGSIISGGISSVIGMGVSLATKGLAALGAKLFKSEGKKTNDIRDEWIEKNYGTQQQLAALAKQAGFTDAELHRLFTLGRVKDFEAMAAKVKERIDAMQEATEKAADELERTQEKRADWLKQTGKTEAELRAIASQAGITEEELQRLFDTTKVDDFDAAAGEVGDKLRRFAQEQAADAERLEKAIEKYGLAWDELGSKLQQKKLDEQAKELIEDWRVLLEAGVDLGKVNAKMSDDVEDFLEKAKETGAEIPAAMRPMLQKMIEQGVLTDESGRKIERLEDIGVTFAQTMTQGFDRVVEKLDEMIRRLLGAGNAIDAIPDSKTVEIELHYTRTGDVPDDEDHDESHESSSSTSGLSSLDPESMPGFAQGTGGRYIDFGSGTPAMLHGKERIITPMESQTAADGVAQMVNAVAGLQVTLVRAIRENALQMRDQALLARG